MSISQTMFKSSQVIFSKARGPFQQQGTYLILLFPSVLWPSVRVAHFWHTSSIVKKGNEITGKRFTDKWGDIISTNTGSCDQATKKCSVINLMNHFSFWCLRVNLIFNHSELCQVNAQHQNYLPLRKASLLPWNNGQIAPHVPIGPRLKYWPTANSM